MKPSHEGADVVAATCRAAVAVVTCIALAGCSGGGRERDGTLAGSPSPSASPSSSPSASAGPSGVDPAVTAAYGALTTSVALFAKDVPAMSAAAQFRTDLTALNAALARGRAGLAAERAARFPPDCPRVLANAAVVHAATAEALAARARITSRAAVVTSASRRVDADSALVVARNAALAAALKATGSVLPPSLPGVDVAGILGNAKAAQVAAATAVTSATSAAATGAANALTQDTTASDLSSVC